MSQLNGMDQSIGTKASSTINEGTTDHFDVYFPTGQRKVKVKKKTRKERERDTRGKDRHVNSDDEWSWPQT